MHSSASVRFPRVFEMLQTHRRAFAFTCILLAGFIVRVVLFGIVPPGGLAEDEAFAGYEAFCLGTWGTDSHGYPWPVYLCTWGGGMNALESYLAIPFVKLLGCTALAIRLPALIVGMAALPYLYLLMKRVFTVRVALVAMAVLAICPWHIMLCRFALESNMAPSLFLIGFYYLLKGTDDARWWLLSALFFGLSLYAYAIMWAVVPFTLLLCALYLSIKRSGLRGFRWRWLAASAALLFALALPLMLFLLVNNGTIPQIVTPFISIPQLPAFREGEFSPANILDGRSWLAALGLLFGFSDELVWNSIPQFGLFYYVSTPFVLLGLIPFIRPKAAGGGSLDARPLVLLWGLAAFVACLMTQDANVNKSNTLHLFSVMLIAAGLCWTFSRLMDVAPKLSKAAWALVCAVYVLCGGWFCVYYFTEYDGEEAVWIKFNDGAGDAIHWVEEQLPEVQTVVTILPWSNVLYFTEMPPDVFRDTVVYYDDHTPYRVASQLGRFEFMLTPEGIGPDKAYIYYDIPGGREVFEAYGLSTITFGRCFVAYADPASS